MKRRHLVLSGALALTLLAVFWVSGNRDDASDEAAAPVVEKAVRPRKDAANKPSSSEPVALPLDHMARTPMSVSDLNPFGAKSWYVPPPPPPPSPPPVPTAPPLPFVYTGKFEQETGHWVIYLVNGDQFYSVSVGETFDSVYRLEAIENGNLVIRYLPLSIKQFLPMGSEL